MRDTSVKHFLSTMPGAPVLTGAAGGLVAILDACLVDGWGLLPATTLQVQSGVATVQFSTPHSFLVDAVALVDGVTGSLAALNGQHKVDSVPTSNSITFATDLPDGLAEGPITVKLAPAGWERVFSATNKRVYRSLAPESLGHMLRVDETGATAPFAARVVGYESMSDIDTGSGPFPTAAQLSGGAYWPVSNIAGGNRPWGVFSDGRIVYLYVSPHSSYSGFGYIGCFGDIDPAWSADAFASVICGGHRFTTSIYGASGTVGAHQKTPGASVAQFMPRNVSASPGGVMAVTQQPGREFASSAGSGAAQGAIYAGAPLSGGGGVPFGRAIVSDSGQIPRGVFPGIMSIPCQISAVSLSTFLFGDIVRCCALNQAYNDQGTSAASVGASYVDITGPWR